MSLRILVVDDSKVSRLMSLGLLRQLRPDAVLVEAENGDKALALMREAPADIAILDMNMPGMTGLELGEKLRSMAPTIAMALLTANVQAAVVQKAEAQGLKFFRKPINETVIRQILTDLGAGAA